MDILQFRHVILESVIIDNLDGVGVLAENPWAAFQGLAGRTVVLTVSDKSTIDAAALCKMAERGQIVGRWSPDAPIFERVPSAAMIRWKPCRCRNSSASRSDW